MQDMKLQTGGQRRSDELKTELSENKTKTRRDPKNLLPTGSRHNILSGANPNADLISDLLDKPFSPTQVPSLNLGPRLYCKPLEYSKLLIKHTFILLLDDVFL